MVAKLEPPPNLDDLADVSVPAPVDQYFLYWDDAAALWKCRALVDADIPASIARDAEVVAAVAAEAAARDAAIAALKFVDLADVQIPMAANLDFIYWDAVAGKWVNISYANLVLSIQGDTYLDDITNVDVPAPTKNDCLKFNGSIWVSAVYNYVFTFSIASFSDGQSTLLLIGSGVWKAIEAIIFAATYNNPPPTSADVKMSINGGAYNDVGNMDAPAYTSGKNYDGAINYPAAKDQYLRFRLDASDGVDPDIEYEVAIYFRNHIRWGIATKNSGFTEADVEGLASNEISNDQTRSMAINAAAGQYLVFAFPSSYTSIPYGADYETDGILGFLFNSLACAFKAPETVSITNSAGYVENYKVYASEQANLGSHTLVTSTAGIQIDPLYYGITEKTDTFLEADIEGLTNHPITNDNTQVWSAVTTGSGEYMLFAFPKRLGIPTFWVGGFEGGFEAPETVSVTNANGWTEDYYVWRSTNSNLGATVVETK